MKGQIDYFKVGVVINLVLFVGVTVLAYAIAGLIKPPMLDGRLTFAYECRDQAYDAIHWATSRIVNLFEAYWGAVGIFYFVATIYFAFEDRVSTSCLPFIIFLITAGLAFMGMGIVWTSWALTTGAPEICADFFQYITPKRSEYWFWYVIATIIATVANLILGWFIGFVIEYRLEES